MLIYIITTSTFFGASFLIYALFYPLISQSDAITKRLLELRRLSGVGKSEEPILTKDNYEKPIFRRLRIAGYRSSKSIRMFQIMKWFLAILFANLFYLIGSFKGLSIQSAFLGSLSILIIGVVLLPRFWISLKISQRRNETIVRFPEVLDLLIICLESGLGFDAALIKVAREEERISKVLSRELIYMSQEILAGMNRSEALRSFSARCGDLPEIRSVVAAIIQSEKVGSSVIKTLRVQADTIRFKRKQKIHEAILTAPLKLAFPLVLFILPAIFVVAGGPALLHMLKQFGLLLGR